MAVPSPCTQICAMNPATGLCRGCWRTIEEIGSWSALGDDDKLLVWQRIRARKTQYAPSVPDLAEDAQQSPGRALQSRD